MAVIISAKYEEKQVTFSHTDRESGASLQLHGILDIPKNIRQENSGAAIIILPGFLAVAADPQLAKEAHKYCELGYSVLRLDFSGMGRSQGKYVNMTVTKQVAEARTALSYVKSLKWIDDERIFLSGHSMGGAVAGLAASEQPEDVAGCILWYPAAVLHDDAMDDRIMRQKYDLSDESLKEVEFSGKKIGRDYFTDAKNLDIYGRSKAYTGDVLLLHGDADAVVPASYSEKYKEVLPKAEMYMIPGGGHGFEGKCMTTALKYATEFLNKKAGR